MFGGNEGSEKKISWSFNVTFLGWQCLHNYSHHRLGRILVCWSESVDVVPVLVSSQMITCLVRFKESNDIFLEMKPSNRDEPSSTKNVLENSWILEFLVSYFCASLSMRRIVWWKGESCVGK